MCRTGGRRCPSNVSPEMRELRNQKKREAYAIKKGRVTKDGEPLTKSHGVLVVKGKYQTGDFIKNFNKQKGRESYYEGTWEQLEQLVKNNKDNFEPGTGSIDNDVVLVKVPAEGFYTSITRVTKDNKHLIKEEEYVRQPGEKPVPIRYIEGIKPPASVVKIVCYRADVLEKDNDRSTDAEWEIIAILAQEEEHVPMHPTTMLRNNNNDEGGTYREYTKQEWEEAYAYWNEHVYVEEK